MGAPIVATFDVRLSTVTGRALYRTQNRLPVCLRE
jgi:hypothetical protein